MNKKLVPAVLWVGDDITTINDTRNTVVIFVSGSKDFHLYEKRKCIVFYADEMGFQGRVNLK